MQLRFVIFGIFLQVFVLFSVPVQALETLILDDAHSKYALSRVFDILEDQEGILSINDIISPEYAKQFFSSNADVPNFGFTQSVYWLRFRLKNNTRYSSKWLLDQGFANTHFMDFYYTRSNGQGYAVKKSGNLRPYSNRDVPHRRIIFSFELPGGAEQTFFLRVKNGASMTLDLHLRTWPDLAESDRSESFWMGLFYGALFIMLGYNLVSFVMLSDPRYGWLVFFITMFSGVLVFYDGYAQQIIGNKLLSFSAWALPFFLALCVIALLKFDQSSYLASPAAERETNTIKYAYRAMLGAWLVLAILVPIVAYGAMLKTIIFSMLLTVVVVIGRNIVSWRRDRRSASFFLVAWSGFLVALAIVALTRLGWLDSSIIKIQFARVSLLWLAFVMSLALVDRINLLRRETERVNTSLRDSERQRRLAMQASNTGTWSWDIANNQTQWSEETEALFGLEKGQFDGRYETYRQLIHPDDLDYLEKNIEQALKLNKAYFVEHRIIRSNGEQRWLAGFGEVFRDKTGQPVSMFGTVRDITLQKQAEQELLQQEKKYRSLFEMASDGIMLLREGYIVDCNTRLLEMYGYTREELLGKTPVDLSPKRQPDGGLSTEMAEAVAARTMQAPKESFEWRHVRKDGSEFDIDVSLNAIDLGGERFFLAIVRDVTERKRSEEAIKNIAAGVSAQTGSIFFEQLVLQLAKIFRADYVFIGLMDEADPLRINTYIFCAHGEIQPNISYILKDTPCANVVGKAPCSYPRNVQNLFPNDTLLADMGVESFTGTPLFAAAGQAIGLLVILDSKPMDNIDYVQEVLSIFAARAGAEMERVRSEQKLAEAEQRLSLHVKQTPLGVIEWDTQFRVTAWNPAAEEIFGYTSHEALGCHASELILTPKVIPRIDKLWQDLLSTRGGTRSSNENKTKDGKIIMCEWYNTSLVTDSGKVMGVASLVVDITDRVQAQTELATYRDQLEEMIEARTAALSAVNKELESFSYSVSHDLRAPLRTINGFSLALLEDYGDRLDDEGRDYLNRLRSASVRMDGLIQNMLSLSRINRQDIQKQDVSLSKMANVIIAELQQADPQRKVECTIQDNMECYGDSQLIRIALDNLLGNAWKYTSKVALANIEFGVKNKNGDTTYYIKDNGAGFDMRYVNKIFDAFQRLHHEREFEGTGVGLATVVRVINRHGGRIWAEAAPNKGAIFYFTLPLRKKTENSLGWIEEEKYNDSLDHSVY